MKQSNLEYLKTEEGQEYLAVLNSLALTYEQLETAQKRPLNEEQIKAGEKLGFDPIIFSIERNIKTLTKMVERYEERFEWEH